MQRGPVASGIILLALLVIGYADYFFGYSFSFDAFYLIPVCLAAWMRGLPASFVTCALSAIVPIAGNVLAGQRNVVVSALFWNSAILFAFYLVVTFLIRRIKALQASLEHQVKERTAKLTTEIASREALERQLLSVSEREQRRLGEDVHDILCQHLTACAISAEVLGKKLAAHTATAADARSVIKLTEEGIAIARDVARGLLAIPLGEEGLAIALEELANKTSDHFRVRCTLVTDFFPALDVEPSVQIYRIVAEAVNNAIRHGKAGDIEIRIGREADLGYVTIHDNGVSFDPENIATSGLGLRIMKHRAQLLNGSLDIIALKGDGVTIRCAFPIPTNEVR